MELASELDADSPMNVSWLRCYISLTQVAEAAEEAVRQASVGNLSLVRILDYWQQLFPS